jgi:hypothetical protein
MSRSNLSVRFINALRQLPQYQCNILNKGPLTHPLTGARISPVGDLSDEEDQSGILEISFPGGNALQVHGAAFFAIALKEGVEIEDHTSPEEPRLLQPKLSLIQRRVMELGDHLRRKHSLEPELQLLMAAHGLRLERRLARKNWVQPCMTAPVWHQ